MVGSRFIRDIHILFLVYNLMAILGILFQLPSAGLMDKRINEIQILQNLGATLGSELDTDELIEKTLKLVKTVVNADISWIELKENDKFLLAGVNGMMEGTIRDIPEKIKIQ